MMKAFTLVSTLVVIFFTYSTAIHTDSNSGVSTTNALNVLSSSTTPAFLPRNNVNLDEIIENLNLILLSTRGGGGGYDEYDVYDDNYDEYGNEEEYDDEYDYDGDGDTSNNYQRRSPPPRTTSNSRRPPPGRRPPPPPSSNRRPNNPRHRRPHPQRRPQQPSTSTKILKSTTDIAQKSLNVATSATISTLKTSGKAAYYLTAPKHVTKQEILGVWRLDQCIGSSACAANIEFTPKGDAITRYKVSNNNGEDNGNDDEEEEEENVTGYLFQSKSWPRSCSIEFEAKAFQGLEDEKPVTYYYKGYFNRKMADRSVIKIVGTIHEVKQGGFWKGGKKGQSMPGVEVGSFVARKRIQAKGRGRGSSRGVVNANAAGRGRDGNRRSQQQQMEQDEYDDYYDDYDGYDEYDEIGGEEYDQYDDE